MNAPLLIIDDLHCRGRREVAQHGPALHLLEVREGRHAVAALAHDGLDLGPAGPVDHAFEAGAVRGPLERWGPWQLPQCSAYTPRR